MFRSTLILFFLMSAAPEPASFKKTQMGFPKVKTAYLEKEKEVLDVLKKSGIEASALEIYIRVFKQENTLELWAKAKQDPCYKQIKTFAICSASGIPGPKRKEGDMQVPEGFYTISHFNPESNFYLSLGINYPNPSDKILADKKHPGSAIYIHGNCVTVGCIPITDDKIKELYLYAVEARNNGQSQIQVSIFPCKMDAPALTSLKKNYAQYPALIEFWENIKQGYLYFEEHKKLPKITVLKNGKYSFHS